MIMAIIVIQTVALVAIPVILYKFYKLVAGKIGL